MAGLSDTLSRFDVSGEILNEDVIGLLTQPDPRVPGAEMELGDCAAAFELLSEVWQEIRTEVADFDTSKLREKWLMPVFELLGHDLTFLRGHTEFANRKTIPLTHQSGVKVPVWMLDYGQSSDDKPTEGRNRRSPHELFQEYLDLTADSWGLLTNGRTLRLLHDYHKSLTRNFVEVDLEAVFESLDFDAFRAVWRIFHANAFKPGAKGVLPIEKLRDFSRQEGTEIGKELRFQVLEAIKVLGNGFLQADVSGELNKALKEEPVALMTFYRALLRIVYRLLFLLYVDNKPNWTPARDRVWSSSYSITRLRREAEDAAAEDGKFFFARAHSEDHWEGLKVVFSIIREGCQAFDAEIHPYGGDLFAEESLWLLKDAPLYNQDLLKAIRLLTMFERRARGRQRQIYRVNFRNLRIDALGSVYEALLDIAPVLKEDGSFDFGDGAERKLSGTYYTPPALVSEIVKAALLPVIEDRLAGVDESDQEAALLNIKVVDPACGSGAFLIQAMDALAAKLCEIRYHGESPTDEQLRAARRDVVTKCIHGVDLNPMAVELCKFTLWLHVAHPELPLSYLEPVIVCGNALVGVPLKAQVEREKKRLAEEREATKKRTDQTPKQKQSALKKLEYVGWPDSIPDEAFNAVTGDDADIAKLLKKRNKEEREGQPSLPFHREETQRELRAQKYLKFKQLSEDNIEAQRQKRELYERWRSDEDTKRQIFEADFWCSAFFWRSEVDGDAPTHHRFREIKEENANAQPVSYWNDGLTQQIRDLARLPEPGDPQSSGLGFFHWELEFPDVDEQGGFDCILGNPPWERIKFDEKEFFEVALPEVALIANKATRLERISQLATSNPPLHAAYVSARHGSECASKFAKTSGRSPLGSGGDTNLFAMFVELGDAYLSEFGNCGMLVPTDIVTAESYLPLFQQLYSSARLKAALDFENKEKLFPIHSSERFCILVIGNALHSTEFAFYLTNPLQLSDPTRRVPITRQDFALMRPITPTCPVLRSRHDLLLARQLYGSHSVLGQSESWNVRPTRIFDMAKPEVAGKAVEVRKLPEQVRHQLSDTRMAEGAIGWSLIYEGKMFEAFSHRAAGVIVVEANVNRPAQSLEASDAQRSDPSWRPLSSYAIPVHEVHTRVSRLGLDGAVLAFKDVSGANNERSLIAAVLPSASANFSVRVVRPGSHCHAEMAVLGANLNSLVFDYVLRQGLAAEHVNDYILNQVPVVAREQIDASFVSQRVLELVYTSYDMREWAKEMGFQGDPFVWNDDRRALLRAELDAYFAKLYGLNRKQLRYILDPHGLSDAELEDITSDWEDPTCSGPHLLPESPTTTFPGETFRVLKEKETAKYGEYRTRRLVLEAWERLERGELT